MWLNLVTKNIKLPWSTCRFPGEMHLPRYSLACPVARINLRLNPNGAPKSWSKPVDIGLIDIASLRHDLAYSQYFDTASGNVADKEMVDELNKIQRILSCPLSTRYIVDYKANLSVGLASSDQKSDLKDRLSVKWTDQLAEELYKLVVKNFRKRRVYVNGIDEIWAADFIDIQSFAEYN